MINRKSTALSSEPKVKSVRYPLKGAQKRKVAVLHIQKWITVKESLLESFFVRKISAVKLLGIHWPI